MMLLDAPIQLDAEAIVGGFQLSDETVHAFQEIGLPGPNMVDSMNLTLQFDRSAQQFSVEKGGVVFDTSYGFVFSGPMESSNGNPEQQAVHAVHLFKGNEEGILNMSSIGYLPTTMVQDFFTNCGISTPMAPHKAHLSDIEPIVESAATINRTTRSTTLFDGPVELTLTENIVATAPRTSFDEEANQDLSPSWQKELSVRVTNYEADPAAAVEAVLRSKNPEDEPQFYGLYAHTEAATGNAELLEPKITTLRGLIKVLEAVPRFNIPDHL